MQAAFDKISQGIMWYSAVEIERAFDLNSNIEF